MEPSVLNMEITSVDSPTTCESRLEWEMLDLDTIQDYSEVRRNIDAKKISM